MFKLSNGKKEKIRHITDIKDGEYGFVKITDIEGRKLFTVVSGEDIKEAYQDIATESNLTITIDLSSIDDPIDESDLICRDFYLKEYMDWIELSCVYDELEMIDCVLRLDTNMTITYNTVKENDVYGHIPSNKTAELFESNQFLAIYEDSSYEFFEYNDFKPRNKISKLYFRVASFILPITKKQYQRISELDFTLKFNIYYTDFFSDTYDLYNYISPNILSTILIYTVLLPSIIRIYLIKYVDIVFEMYISDKLLNGIECSIPSEDFLNKTIDLYKELNIMLEVMEEMNEEVNPYEKSKINFG
jgi:hypothetical protein